ncbi:MAG: hypothetical protein JJU20_03000 [Opitutales bacterium]|nr:hypothetical protein [Opitutales bacterium]
MIVLGVSKRSITPESALRLSGYAERRGPYESVREAIYVRVHAFAVGNQRILLIYGDLIWWGKGFIDELRPELAAWFQLDPSAFVFIASHNHSGPATSQDFSDSLESYDTGYGKLLTHAVRDGIANALRDLEPVQMTLHRGRSGLGIYRRKQINGQVKMLPNPEIKTDKTLSVVAMHRHNGSLKALAVHYACHPTVSRENYLHPDYPGVLLRLLEESQAGCHCIFLQGCAADIRPNLVLNDEFLAGNYNDVLDCAEALHKDCLDALGAPGQSLQTVGEEQLIQQVDVRLEMMPDSAKEVPEGSDPVVEILQLTRIRIASDLQWIGFNAEVSQYYNQYLQSILPGCLGIGYCNGMIGYVCSRQQILEGGYEPVESVFYFGLAGPFSPAIQSEIEKALDQLIRN